MQQYRAVWTLLLALVVFINLASSNVLQSSSSKIVQLKSDENSGVTVSPDADSKYRKGYFPTAPPGGEGTDQTTPPTTAVTTTNPTTSIPPNSNDISNDSNHEYAWKVVTYIFLVLTIASSSVAAYFYVLLH